MLMERRGAPATGAPQPECELAVDEALHRRRRRLEVRFGLGATNYQRVQTTRLARHDAHGLVTVLDPLGDLLDDYKLLDGNRHLVSL